MAFIGSRRPLLSLGQGVVLFSDDFDRADTLAGSLGTPPNGVPYNLYLPYVDSYPPPTDTTVGYIASNRVTADVNQTFYFNQVLQEKITRIGATMSWVLGPGGVPPAQSTLAMLISADSNILFNVGVHLAVIRNNLNLKKIINGVFSSTLATATVSYGNTGAVHKVEVFVYPSGRCRVESDGLTVIDVTDPTIVSNCGQYPIWEVFNPQLSMIDLGRFESVWAGTT